LTEMFCFQCEQTAGGKGCTRIGICGKNADVASAQDELTGALIGLARAAEGKKPDRQIDELIMQALFATLTNVNFDAARIEELKEQVERERLSSAVPRILMRRAYLAVMLIWRRYVLHCSSAYAVWPPMPGMPIFWVKTMVR